MRDGGALGPGLGDVAVVGSLAEARVGHTATALPTGGVLVVGGTMHIGGTPRVGEPCARAELYDPTSGTWTAVPGPATPRWGHTATLLADGSVLALGGEDGRGEPLASAELLSLRQGLRS